VRLDCVHPTTLALPGPLARSGSVTDAATEPADDPVPDVDTFCRALHPRLVGALALRTGSRALAEELAQETFVRVWERWPTVRAATSPEAWAFRVALNLTSSRFRRLGAERRARARLEARPVDHAALDTGGPERAMVRDAVAALPPRQRTAVVLRYFSGLSVAETATAMGCAEGTVKSLTAKAVDALRRSLHTDLEEPDHG
jgi:RNA polymerase sigma-70 factor (sigma-E family)